MKAWHRRMYLAVISVHGLCQVETDSLLKHTSLFEASFN